MAGGDKFVDYSVTAFPAFCVDGRCGNPGVTGNRTQRQLCWRWDKVWEGELLLKPVAPYLSGWS